MTDKPAPQKSAIELLSEIEAMLDKAHNEASMTWHSEDHDNTLNRHRAKIAKRIEQWRNEQ